MLPRRYRVETFSGDVIDVEVVDIDKKTVAIKIPSEKGEIKVIIRKIIGDEQAIVEIDGEIFKVDLSNEAIFIDQEPSLINRIVELIPIGLKTSYEGKKQVITRRKGEIRAPLSGKIIEVKVKKGDVVKEGDVVVLLESMKMVTEIKSDVNGVVEEVKVEPGKAVNRGTVLLRIKPPEEEK